QGSSIAAQQDQQTASATTADGSDTDTSTSSATTEDTTTDQAATSTPTSSAPESSADACDGDDIARVLDRDEIIVEVCTGDWAYVYSDVPGDSAAFVRRVDGSWTSYDGQPGARCRSEAKADGAPTALLEFFTECQDTLGLSTPISRPACDGSGIVVLSSATTPGSYREDVEALLERFPDASYLRTDFSCPSLAQETDEGDPIYAVYRSAGDSRQAICQAVREAPAEAYGKRLEESAEPDSVVDC
ncbi:MAG: hypothetical protein WBG57_04000, partial [Ornithinimicrobium sp.]